MKGKRPPRSCVEAVSFIEIGYILLYNRKQLNFEYEG